MTTILICLVIAVLIFVFGFFVGRNNPNISAVNDLISSGKAAIDATGKIIKKL